MFRFTAIFCVILVSFSSTAQDVNYSLKTNSQVIYNELEAGFRQPPPQSRLRCYWWWLNSYTTKETITSDLEEMKTKGYGGATLVDAGSSSYDIARKTIAGPRYMSPAWMELYKFAVKEAERLGIELSVNLGSGWNPGGPSITPEYAMKKLVYTDTIVSGGKELHLRLPEPEKNLLYKDVLVQAIREKETTPIKDSAIENWSIKSFNQSIGWKGIYPLYKLREDFPGSGEEYAVMKDEIVDLTDKFRDGNLVWDAPVGKWTIIRYGYTCTGARTSTSSDGWHGLSVDHLSAKAFHVFADSVILPLIKVAQSAGNSVKYLLTDSWEMGVVNWTDDFPAEFKKCRGYDIQPYMPVLAGHIVESREVSDRFLHDYRRTVSDLVADKHYKLLYDLAHQYGLGIHPESGGPHSAPIDALEIMAISDYPQGEFWARSNTHRVKDAERLSVRQSASVAHTNAKRFVAAEGPTSIGPQWERSPKDLKANIDRILCSGVNRIVWHTFTSSPKEFGKPGNEYFAGTHLNPNVTWWDQAGAFINYLNRSSFMLQQGLFVADVLCYYGDDVPNFVFLKEEIPELDAGYDWDKCSRDVILNEMTYDGHKIVLPDGMSYHVLMLPNEKTINLEVLRKIEKLVQEGMTLIGPKPLRATGLIAYPESDHEVQEIAKRLWGNIDGKNITEHVYGKGRVIWGRNINQVLADMKVSPDFTFTGSNENTGLNYIHRTTNDQEIYFVVNKFNRTGINDLKYRYLPSLPDLYEQVECSFRVTGKVPELWNPVTGKISEIITWREEGGRTIIPLHFDPEGSRFIIFRTAETDSHVVQIEKDGKQIFPGNEPGSGKYPLLSFDSIKNGIAAEVYYPGKYTLTWSDGHMSRINRKKSMQAQTISAPWIIHFDTSWGGPQRVHTDSLKSWTDFQVDGIKYFSGKAVYVNSFRLKKSALKNSRILLDLGNVQEMAVITINGHELPIRWKAPFQADITSYVHIGDNEFQVAIINLWPNRLIGDSKLPEEKRFTKTNVRKFNAPDSEKYLRVSGLLGPVKIIEIPLESL